MCPSYRVTRDEQHVTRGRANSLRLALSGQLGPDALSSDEMAQTMALCVSCKGCKRECPTGVDMARMKIEFLHHYGKRRGIRLRSRLIAWLPRYASALSRHGKLVNGACALPGMQWLLERLLGLSRHRSLPRWASPPFVLPQTAPQPGREVVLFADTFNRYFEPENLHDAVTVLRAAGCEVQEARPLAGARPLCCGRTFLAAGLVEQAREEARHVIGALLPHALRGRPIIGLEPSCLLGLRDEYRVLGVRPGDVELVARHALLFEEFIAREARAKRLSLPLAPLPQTVLLHGHCHQKAFDGMDAVKQTLGLIPELKVQEIESSCCGMAGNFGFEAEHFAVSMKMAEAALLPAVRAAPQALVAADGTSCRHQIHDGAGRQALHVARLLRRALKAGGQ
jgi:Fe-S oxidoreductase